jgi:hypothetical protein
MSMSLWKRWIAEFSR